MYLFLLLLSKPLYACHCNNSELMGFEDAVSSDPRVRFCKFYGLQNFLLCKVRFLRAIKSYARNENRAHAFVLRNVFLKLHGGPPIIISHSFISTTIMAMKKHVRVTYLQNTTMLLNFNVPIFFHYDVTHDRKL